MTGVVNSTPASRVMLVLFDFMAITENALYKGQGERPTQKAFISDCMTDYDIRLAQHNLNHELALASFEHEGQPRSTSFHRILNHGPLQLLIL
jgi:hypothetical protein